MKTLIWIVSILTVVTLSSMQQTTDVKGLLEKPDTRQAIFTAIMSDPHLMSEFMQEMHNSKYASMYNENGTNGQYQGMSIAEMYSMMRNNPAMLKTMMGNMINVVSSDSTLSRDMVNMMYSHSGMMNYMGHMYNQGGMMGPGNGMMNNRSR